MQTLNATIITNDKGRQVQRDQPEPEPGSVVLQHGEFGTAWQRHFDDGLWHNTLGGKPKRWSYLTTRRNVLLVYEASVRGDQT